MLYCADFETTTDINDCRVWAYAIIEIDNLNNYKCGNSLDDFMENICFNKNENKIIYFHNLKFDGMFIMYWLFEHGYKHVINKDEIEGGTFTTLISDKGQFYSIEVYKDKKGKKANKVTFYDSLKILNFSVEKIAKDFKLPISKLEIDYNAKREKGQPLTDKEKDYIRNDVEIMARALKIMFDKKMTKMTIGSDALEFYKNVVSKKNFNAMFPLPKYDSDIRKSYKGGWTYLNDKYKNKIVNGGIVLDVNSLYPSVMYYNKLPFGNGIYYKGKYKNDEVYNLYIQRLSCQFELKKNHVPTIQIKNNLSFAPTEYLKSSGNEEVYLTLTNVDLQLLFDHYDVYNITWIDGYKFKSSENLFKKYIDYWIKVKINSKKEGNGAMYQIAKLMLNSLYGKFALNPQVRSKIPYYDETEKLLKWKYGEYEEREPIYIPVGTFITSYAREKTIRSAQLVYNRFIYADTDSLHLEGFEIPKVLEIDDFKLGAWKNEFVFSKGKYLRQKCYMEHGKDPFEKGEEYTKITCAGMPSRCYEQVNFENFNIGSVYTGKLAPKNVHGGVILEDSTFTIKNSLI